MEQNRKILLNALQHLASYTPPNQIWEDLEDLLPISHLQKSINSLTKHEPPTSIWENIEEELESKSVFQNLSQYTPPDFIWDSIDEELNNSILEKALNKLPLHAPPAFVWENIGVELKTKEVKIIQFKPWRLAIAASLIGFVFSFSWLNTEPNKLTNISQVKNSVAINNVSKLPHIKIIKVVETPPSETVKINNKKMQMALIFSEEKIDERLLLKEDTNAENQYMLVKQFCQQEIFVCQTNDFQQLKSELERLNSASQELKTAMGEFNTDPDMMAQLTQIELQRADIIKKIVAKI